MIGPILHSQKKQISKFEKMCKKLHVCRLSTGRVPLDKVLH